MNLKCLLSLPIALLFAAVVGLAAERSSTHKPDSQTQSQLDAFRRDHVQGLIAATPERVTNYYAEEVRLMPEHQLTVLGKANAAAYHAAFAARFDVGSYERTPIESLDLGAQVFELGTFRMMVTPKGGGKQHELVGKYLDGWSKSSDGRLALIVVSWNYDHQVEIADELRFHDVPAVRIAFQPRLLVQDRSSFEMAALEHLLEATVVEHDAKVWAQFYADDAILLHSYSAPIVGRKAVDEFLENHVKQLPVFEKLDVRTDRVDDLGGYVVEYASHVANWRSGDHSGVNTGKNLKIWRREADGSLKIFRSIGMYE